MKIHKARKNHRCDLCGRLIPKGVRYWRIYDDMYDDKQHTNCLDFEGQPEVDIIDVQNMNSSAKQTQTKAG